MPNGTTRWMSSMALNWSSVVFWMTPSQLYPALFTMISTEPNVSMVASTSFCGNEGSVRSPGNCSTWYPASRRLHRVSHKAVLSRSLTITAAPQVASLVAIARPMPRPEPLTIAVLPSSVTAMLILSVIRPYDALQRKKLLRCIKSQVYGLRQAVLGCKKKARPKPCQRGEMNSSSDLLINYQVVLNAERAEQLIRTDAGDLFIHRIIDASIQSEPAAIHNDADRACRVQAIAAQHRVSIDGPHCAQTQVVIEGRDRGHTNVIHDVLDSRRALNDRECRITAYVRQGYTRNRHYSVFYAQGEIVEQIVVAYAVVAKLLAQLGLKLRVRYSRPGDVNEIPHTGRMFHLARSLGGIELLLVHVYRARQCHDPIFHAGANVAKLTFVRQLVGNLLLDRAIKASHAGRLSGGQRAEQRGCRERAHHLPNQVLHTILLTLAGSTD